VFDVLSVCFLVLNVVTVLDGWLGLFLGMKTFVILH
jgi:hypothetical protein